MCVLKNQNASRPSGHPPVGENMSKRLGGIIGCKDKTSSWHLNGFPYGSNIGLSCHLFWTSHVWTHQPRSHRWNVTQDFSTFLLRCVCVFFPFILDIKFVGRTSRGHTGFLIHLSAVRALIFLARRIQPFLSLVDRGVEFCVLTIEFFSTRWAFLFLLFSFLVRKIPFCRYRTHVPTCQKVTWLPLSYRGDRLCLP